jgi:hypothetical protein
MTRRRARSRGMPRPSLAQRLTIIGLRWMFGLLGALAMYVVVKGLATGEINLGHKQRVRLLRDLRNGTLAV